MNSLIFAWHQKLNLETIPQIITLRKGVFKTQRNIEDGIFANAIKGYIR